MAAKNAGTATSRVTIPKIPYVPPPTNPKEMPAWYERFHREMDRWREQTNQVIVGQTV